MLQVHSVSLKTAGEKVRIQLKQIETLSYSCTSTEDLLELNMELRKLKAKFESKLPHREGIVLHAAVSQAHKVKRKYAQLQKKQTCSALIEGGKRRKRKMNSKYKNRVGAKAERLRKVIPNTCCNINELVSFMCI